MSDTCLTCGLPKDLCVCESIAKQEQRIEVRKEKRKFGKPATVIAGLDPKTIDLKDLTKKLKSKMACGGTVRGDTVELQGDHTSKIKEVLVKLGFEASSIDVK
jgi:translation initiation factor 1